MGCHFLLQEIFSTQGFNLGLLHCRWIFLPTEPTGKPIINLLPLNYKYTLCYLLSENADGSFAQRTVLGFISMVHWGDLEEEAFLSRARASVCVCVCGCVYTIAIIQSRRGCEVLNITGAPPQLSAQKCSPLQTCSPGLVTTSLWPSWHNSACNLHRHTHPPTYIVLDISKWHPWDMSVLAMIISTWNYG